MNGTQAVSTSTPADLPLKPAGRPELSQRHQATLAFAKHWPEYFMEAAELGLFMVSACSFTVLLEHPASPVYQMLPNPLLRMALIGIAMGLTLLSICRIGATMCGATRRVS